jgi:hypothetical protein
MNIKQYIETQRQQIGTVLQRERLACSLVATVQGPLTLTYKLRVNNPDRQAMTHLLQLGGVLQSVLLVESVRIQQVSGLIEIQIPSPAPITPTATDMRNASQGLNVAIGWDALGKPLQIDFAQHGAVFWVGPSRRGKTQSMRSTLYSVSKSVQGRLRYCIICQASKRDDWKAFDTSKHSMGIVTDFDEIEQAIRWFSQRTQQGRTQHEYVVLVDDLPSILQRCKIAKDLADIASVGAGVGVHLLAGSQAAGSKAGSGGELIEANITARIVYKPASKATAARNAGQGGMDLDQLSSAKGDAVLLVDGYPERIATSIAYDAEIATLPQGRINATWRPWQHGQGGASTGAALVQAPVQGGALVYDMSAPSAPVQVVQGFDADTFKLPMDRALTMQEKLQLCKAHAHFGSKNKTMQSVFGYKSSKSLALLDDALQYANTAPDVKIIKLSERRIA